jgi:hypothetical protein
MSSKIIRNQFFTNPEMIIIIIFNFDEYTSRLMSVEMEEKSTRIENEEQKQIVQTIKSGKKEHSPEQRSITSMSSTIQDNTT